MNVTRGCHTSDVIELDYGEIRSLQNGRTIEGSGVRIVAGKCVRARVADAIRKATEKGVVPSELVLPHHDYKELKQSFCFSLHGSDMDIGVIPKYQGMEVYQYSGNKIIIA
jgi:hypothetical protein